MTTVKMVKLGKQGKQKSSMNIKAFRPKQKQIRDSVQAIQAFLKKPPALTSEEAKELDLIIQTARADGLVPQRRFLRREGRGGKGGRSNGESSSGYNRNQ